MSNFKRNMIESEIIKVVQSSFSKLRNEFFQNKILSVNYAKLAKDRSYVDLYVSSFDDNIEKIIKELNKVKGFIRTELARNINTFKVPEVRFHKDEGMKASLRVNQILADLNIPSEESKKEEEDNKND
jgi:ribosome-binding factor A